MLASSDESVVRDMFDVIIGELVLFLNVGKTMTAAQIKSTINLILLDPIACSMSFEDYKVCFDNFKKGIYGITYDRVDGQIILQVIYSYFSEKSAIIEQANELQHDKLKNQSRSTDIIKDLGLDENNFLINKTKEDGNNKPTPEMWKQLKDNLRKLANNTNAKKIRPEKTEHEKMIQEFMKQFDKLWMKKPVDAKSGKFIKRYGKIITIVEFVEYKLKQIELVEKRK